MQDIEKESVIPEAGKASVDNKESAAGAEKTEKAFRAPEGGEKTRPERRGVYGKIKLSKKGADLLVLFTGLALAGFLIFAIFLT